jgi:hypothetical protein
VLGEKIPRLRKKSGKYTGWKSTSFGRQKIRGISVWGAYLLSDQHSVKSCFVFYYNAVISTMEFPPETYDVFEADQFESARAHLTGDAVMEVMLQMRPNGRCLDHYRNALDGTVLETQVVATNVFRAPVLAKYRLTYQAWPRNLKIRQYMTTTAWVDSYIVITAVHRKRLPQRNGDRGKRDLHAFQVYVGQGRLLVPPPPQPCLPPPPCSHGQKSVIFRDSD